MNGIRWARKHTHNIITYVVCVLYSYGIRAAYTRCALVCIFFSSHPLSFFGSFVSFTIYPIRWANNNRVNLQNTDEDAYNGTYTYVAYTLTFSSLRSYAYDINGYVTLKPLEHRACPYVCIFGCRSFFHLYIRAFVFSCLESLRISSSIWFSWNFYIITLFCCCSQQHTHTHSTFVVVVACRTL